MDELQDMVNVRPGPNGQRLLLRRTADRTRRPCKPRVPEVSDRTRTAGSVRLPLWAWSGRRRHRAGQDVPARREHHVQLRDSVDQRLQPSHRGGGRHGRRHAQHRLDHVRSDDGRAGGTASTRARFSSDWGSTGRSFNSQSVVRGPWFVARRASLPRPALRATNYELRTTDFPNVQLPKGPAKAGPLLTLRVDILKSLCGTHVDISFKHPPRSRQPTGCRRLSRASAAARHRRRRPLPR